MKAMIFGAVGLAVIAAGAWGQPESPSNRIRMRIPYRLPKAMTTDALAAYMYGDTKVGALIAAVNAVRPAWKFSSGQVAILPAFPRRGEVCFEDSLQFCSMKELGRGLAPCLYHHLENLQASCRAFLEPCYEDQKTYCPGRSDLWAIRQCLGTNVDRLSKACVNRTFPCANDLKQYCRSKDLAKGAPCLRQKGLAVSSFCRDALNDLPSSDIVRSSR